MEIETADLENQATRKRSSRKDKKKIKALECIENTSEIISSLNIKFMNFKFAVPCEGVEILTPEEMHFIENLHESVAYLQQIEGLLKRIKEILNKGKSCF